MSNIVTKSSLTILGLIALAIILLGLIGTILGIGMLPAENFIGMVIVLAIGVLLMLLLIMTVAFARLDLTDPKQALGLPEGSIRALIALILIMVFIIVGIYLFRTVSDGSRINLPGLTAAEVADLGTKLISAHQNDSGTYDVTVRVEVTDDGARLAQQLITTIGTLVVAVAGFYFGTGAVTAARGGTAGPSLPVIRDIDPKEGAQGSKDLSLKITGKNFRSPKTVRLVQGPNEIVGIGILSSDTEIHCKINIDSKKPTGKWDLIVLNEDGGEDKLAEIFAVTSSVNLTTTTNQ